MRELSSRWTFFYKFILPFVFVPVFAWAAWVIVTTSGSSSGSEEFRGMRWIFVAVMMAGGGLIFWFGVRLKVVSLRGDTFVVSNFMRRIEVPIDTIERVSGTVLVSPELITLHLRRPSEFGDRVVFIPKLRLASGFSRHPLVGELSLRVSQTAGIR